MVELHPELRALLDDVYALGLFDWDGLDAVAVRRKFAAIKTVPDLPHLERLEDFDIQGTGGPVPCRFYHPGGQTLLPLLVWFHGGGWVLGTLEQEEASARMLALCGDMAVLSVGYRLAPEHPFPCAFQDALAAFDWAQQHARSLNCRPDAIAVGGSSAGGNLAAVVSLMRVLDEGPAPAHQVLVYPVTDHDLDRGSMHEFGDGLVLHRSHMQWFWDQYVPDVATRKDWRASPLLAPSHANLPPATMLLAACDPLVDEGVAYARLLQQADVPLDLRIIKGMTHGFMGMASKLDAARVVVESMARDVGLALRRG